MFFTLKKKQTEEKVKVVGAVWGTEFVQFYSRLLYCTDIAPEWFQEKDD